MLLVVGQYCVVLIAWFGFDFGFFMFSWVFCFCGGVGIIQICSLVGWWWRWFGLGWWCSGAFWVFAVGCYGGLSCGGSFAGLGWYGRWCWDLVPSGGNLGLGLGVCCGFDVVGRFGVWALILGFLCFPGCFDSVWGWYNTDL